MHVVIIPTKTSIQRKLYFPGIYTCTFYTFP